MRFAFIVSIFVALSAPAFAQTHPCDQFDVPVVVVPSGAPHRISFCSPRTDNVEAIVAYLDGVAFDLVAVSAKTAPSASGLVQFETGLILQVARGDHSLEVAAYNRNQLTGQLQLGPKSSPFSYGAVDPTPLPSAPVIKGVTR